MPGSNRLPLAGPEAKFLRRASFLKHNLWVTAFNRDEQFPGGEFPNHTPRIDEGLATWVKLNRPLEEADIVLWLVLILCIWSLFFFLLESIDLVCVNCFRLAPRTLTQIETC